MWIAAATEAGNNSVMLTVVGGVLGAAITAIGTIAVAKIGKSVTREANAIEGFSKLIEEVKEERTLAKEEREVAVRERQAAVRELEETKKIAEQAKAEARKASKKADDAMNKMFIMTHDLYGAVVHIVDIHAWIDKGAQAPNPIIPATIQEIIERFRHGGHTLPPGVKPPW